MALQIKNKFTGTATISGSSVSIDLPFAVTQSKSILIAHIRTGSDYVDESCIHADFTDNDTIVFSVHYSASASIDWQVIEFSSGSDITIYRGNNSVSSAETDIDLSDTVDVTKSFPLLYMKNDGYNIDLYDCVRARILDTGGGDIKLRLNRTTGSTLSLNYQVIYCSGSDIVVDQYDYTWASGTTLYDRTVSTYDLSKAFLIGTFSTTYSASGLGMGDIPFLKTDSTTTLRHRRYNTGVALDCTFYHVKMQSVHLATGYTNTWVATETYKDNNLSGSGVEDLSRSFLLMGSAFYQFVSSANDTNDDFGEAGMSPNFTTIDNVRVTRINSTTGARSEVFVIEITPDTALSSDWTTSRKLIISNACVDSNLTDFNVVIKNNLPSAIYSSARTDGGDLRFTTDSSGTTIIPRHVVYFNKAGNECIVWLKVPTVLTVTNTEIYVWSGNSVAVEPPRQSIKGQEGTWSNNIVARWGMNDLTTSTIEDSTSTYATLTKLTATEPTEVTGKVYKAQNYDGGDGTQAGTKASLSGTGAFTVAALVKTSASAEQHIVSQRNGGFNGEYALEMLATGKATLWAYGGSGYQWTDDPESSTSINNNAWHWVCGVRDASGNGKIYVDGSLEDTQSQLNSVPLSNTLETNVGYDKRDVDDFWTGDLEEVRIINAERSADWIKAEWCNLNNPNTFIYPETVNVTTDKIFDKTFEVCSEPFMG